jgi:hypothetical protein
LTEDSRPGAPVRVKRQVGIPPNSDGFVSLECSFSFLQLDLDAAILDADILDTF